MKRNAIARIVIYSVLVLLLTSILCAFLITDQFPIIIGSGSGTIVDDEMHFSAMQIKNIQIDWAAGYVDIYAGDSSGITISESMDESCPYKMVYILQGNTLTVSYASGAMISGNLSLPEKRLIITVPQNWTCSELEIDGAALTIDIQNLTVQNLDLDGAACTMRFNGSVKNAEIDGAATDITLNCSNRVSAIDVDGASCALKLTLPQGCGFLLEMNGLNCNLHTDLAGISNNHQTSYGDGHCKISVDGLSCDVTIAEGSPSSSEKPECAHTWDAGTLISNTDICYTCTLCGETYTATDDNLVKQEKYQNAVALAGEGKKGEAAIAFAQLGDYSDAKDRCLALWRELSTHTTVISYKTGLLIGIRSDGTVITHSPFPEIEGWTNLCSLASGMNHIVGLRANGTVVAAGDNSYGQCDVQTWTDIVSIKCGYNFTVGLKADGTVILAGELEYNLDSAQTWTDVVMLEAAGYNLICLRYDGTALALGKEDNDLIIVPGYNDIIDIYLDHQRAIYLRADGTIQVTGNALYIQNQTIPGLQTVESDGVYLAGKLLNGSMYFEGYNYPHDINSKGDIVAIIDFALRKLALCSDGRLVFLFRYSESNAEHPEWDNLMIP